MFDNLKERNNLIINDSILGYPVKYLCKKYSLSESMIRNILRNSGVKYQARVYLTESQREYIINNYNKNSSTNIANKIGCSRSAVLKVWMDNNLKGKDTSRMYYCNFNYFNNIDCPEKAYWIGLYAADGCVFERKGHQASINLSLHVDDEHTLMHLNKSLNSNYKIVREGNMITLSIVSDSMADDLKKYNIVPNKTWTFYPTNIPKEYYIDFIIGYLDGDGSISRPNDITKRIPSRYRISIVGNLKCMNKIKEMLSNYNIESVVKMYNQDKYTNDFGELRIHGTTNKYLFSKLYLCRSYNTFSRKKNRFLEYVSLVEENKTNRSENIRAITIYNQLKNSWNL